MLYFEYIPETAYNLLASYAGVLQTSLVNNRVIIPEEVGSGGMNYTKLFDGSEVVISNYSLNDMLLLRRSVAKQIRYFLAIDISRKVRLNISSSNNRNSVAYEDAPYAVLGASFMEYSFLIPAHSRMHSLVISLSPHWVANQVSNGDETTLLNRYLDIAHNQQQVIPLDDDFREKLYDTLDVDMNDPLYDVKINTRVTRLIEHFYLTLQQMFDGQKQITEANLHWDEIERLYTVEKMVTENLTDDFPDAEKLAKAAAMSTSTLQRKFKRFFGYSVFEYYQNYKLEEARRMLLIKKMNVQSVAYNLGYKDPAHFSRAYKKKFGFTPSQTV